MIPSKPTPAPIELRYCAACFERWPEFEDRLDDALRRCGCGCRDSLGVLALDGRGDEIAAHIDRLHTASARSERRVLTLPDRRRA